MSDPHGTIGIYRKGGSMISLFKQLDVSELIQRIYEDNYSHFDFMENMNGGDCDCNLHMTMNLIHDYLEEK
jgi:hypothetical protein